MTARSKIKNKRSRLIAAVLILMGGMVIGISCKASGPASQVQKASMVYTCPMHHQIRRDQPGDCPICGMTLIPLEEARGKAATSIAVLPMEKRIKFWANPMNPAQHSPKPAKDEMGMDYIPVYQDESTPPASDAAEADPTTSPQELRGLAPVHLSPYKEQLIGVRFTTVEKSPLSHTIHTTGRFGGGEGGFANLAAEFAAGRALHSSARYVVADIYALDIPFVKTGEKAWVSPLSGTGSRVEGKVAEVYPYDATQSRIARVRIDLSRSVPGEIFGNVEIEAVTEPRTAVSSAAIMDTGTRQYVFKATGPGVLTPMTVTVGFHGDDLWEITSGLEAGDKVVDGANFMVDADSKIQSAFSESE